MLSASICPCRRTPDDRFLLATCRGRSGVGSVKCHNVGASRNNTTNKRRALGLIKLHIELGFISSRLVHPIARCGDGTMLKYRHRAA